MIRVGKKYSLIGYPGAKGDPGNGAAIKAGTVVVTGGTVDFQNSNSITFGLATNGVMTASFSAANAGGGSWAINTKAGSDIQISTGSSINTLYYGNFLTTAATGVGGGGDMYMSVYDTNSNSIIDKAAELNDGTYSANASDVAYAVQSDIDRESSGLVSGGDLSIGTPTTTLSVTAGVGYINDGTGNAGSYKRIVWGAFNNVDHVGNTYNHVAINPDGSLDVSLTKQSLTDHVYLGCLFFSQGANRFNVVWKTPCWAGNYNYRNSKFIRAIFKALVVSGFEVTEQDNPDYLKLNTTGGSMYLDLTELTYDAKTTLTKLYSCADYGITPNYTNLNTVDVSHWNDVTQNHGTALVEMTTNYWKKDLVVMNAYGTVYVIYGTTEYSTEDAAKSAPLPSWYEQLIEDGNAFLATIVCQKEDTSIINRLTDIRPIFSNLFISNSSSGVMDYNDLINKPDHNDLNSIQGGQADERYHLAGGYYSSITGGSYQTTGAYLTTAAQSVHTHDYQSTGAYLTTAMASNAGSLFLPVGNSTDYATSVLSTKFLTTAQAPGAYLTTAMVSNAASNFVGLNSAATNMTMTVNSSGISISNPGWLTTAAQSGHTHGAGTTASTAGSDLVITSASNSWQFGIPKWLTTAMASENTSLYQSTGAYLTTAMASNESHYSATSQLSATFVNTGQSSAWQTATLSNTFQQVSASSAYQTATLSTVLMPLSYSSGFQTATLSTKFLTTAASSDHTHGAGSTASTAGTDLKFTTASNGWTLGVPAWITTAAAGGGVAIAGSNATYTSGTVVFRGTNITVSTSAGGQYIDLSVAAPGAGGGIAASLSGNSTSAGGGYSNITSGTMILAGGDNITLSQNASRITIIGASANGPASIVFSDGSGVTWGSAVAGSTTTITASVNAGGGGVAVGQSQTTYTSGTVYISGANLTINSSVNGASQYVQISNRAAQILSFYENIPFIPVTQTMTVNSRSWVLVPFVVPQDVSFAYIRMLISQGPAVSTTMGTTANTTMTASAANTSYAVIYSQGAGANSDSLQYIGSTWAEVNKASFSFTADPTNGSYYTLSVWQTYPGLSGGAEINKSTAHALTQTNINISYNYSSALTGAKVLDMPWATSLSAGNYWLALGESRNSGTNVAAATRLLSVSGNMSLIVASQPNNAYGVLGVATAVSAGSTIAGGLWTTNAQGTTNSIAMNAISSSASHNRPYFQLWRKA
jgi:hypothetical protein